MLAVLVSMLCGCTATQQVRLQAQQHYEFAQRYLGSDSYLLAEQEIRKALDLVSDDPRYFELLALIYQVQGRLHLADEAFRAALRQKDVPPSVLMNYSNLLLVRERWDEAIALVQRVLQDPSYEKPAIAHNSLGLAYFEKDDLQQAVKHFRTALEYQPGLPEAHHNLGRVYARLEERERAIREFREAIRFRPDYVEAHASLGQVLLAVGRTDEARTAFERVVNLAPDSDMAVASRQQLKLLTP